MNLVTDENLKDNRINMTLLTKTPVSKERRLPIKNDYLRTSLLIYSFHNYF